MTIQKLKKKNNTFAFRIKIIQWIQMANLTDMLNSIFQGFCERGITYWFYINNCTLLLKLLLTIKKQKNYKHTRTKRMGKLTIADEGCPKNELWK